MEVRALLAPVVRPALVARRAGVGLEVPAPAATQAKAATSMRAAATKSSPRCATSETTTPTLSAEMARAW